MATLGPEIWAMEHLLPGVMTYVSTGGVTLRGPREPHLEHLWSSQILKVQRY